MMMLRFDLASLHFQKGISMWLGGKNLFVVFPFGGCGYVVFAYTFVHVTVFVECRR